MAVVSDFRTELLVSGYGRQYCTSLSNSIFETILNFNSTAYRQNGTYMVAFIPNDTKIFSNYDQPTKFMAYDFPDHISIKKCLKTILALNSSNLDVNQFKLWKWQYVPYQHNNSRKRVDKSYANPNNVPIYPNLGWHGWAHIAPHKLVRERLSKKEYYWCSISPPQHRITRCISYNRAGPMARFFLKDKMDTDDIFHGHYNHKQARKFVSEKFSKNKRRIIQSDNNYYFWMKKWLSMQRKMILLPYFDPIKYEVLTFGYIRSVDTSIHSDIIGLCLKFVVSLNRDFWDLDANGEYLNFTSNCNNFSVDSITNNVFAITDQSHLLYAFGLMTISKFTVSKTWRIKVTQPVESLLSGFTVGLALVPNMKWIQNKTRDKRRCEDIQQTQMYWESDDSNNIHTNRRPIQYVGYVHKQNDVVPCKEAVITMKYEKKTMHNTYGPRYGSGYGCDCGELLFAINNEELTKKCHPIQIHNNETYKLIVTFNTKQTVQILQ
eukprot:85259_1